MADRLAPLDVERIASPRRSSGSTTCRG